MSVQKIDNLFMPFSQLRRGSPFTIHMTIYSLTDGREEPREHTLFKLNSKKAVTLNKRVVVYIPATEKIQVCRMAS